jgi:hypothetical protein
LGGCSGGDRGWFGTYIRCNGPADKDSPDENDGDDDVGVEIPDPFAMQQPAKRVNSPECLYNPQYSAYLDRLDNSQEMKNDIDRMVTRGSRMNMWSESKSNLELGIWFREKDELLWIVRS